LISVADQSRFKKFFGRVLGKGKGVLSLAGMVDLKASAQVFEK
jgi:hypothetical protein